MKMQYIPAVILTQLIMTGLFPSGALAREAPLPVELDVTIGGVETGASIPTRFGFCRPDGKGKTTVGENVNPRVSWSQGPEETKSYVLLVVDRDVPASFELANKPGKVIPRDYARQDFYHWVLTDIPASTTSIPEGAVSNGVVDGGHPVGETAYGVTGRNDYATFMKGTHGGYGGPCPPWNDERVHNYHFIVFALDVHTLGLTGAFTGRDVITALDGHIVGKGSSFATYSNNAGLLR